METTVIVSFVLWVVVKETRPLFYGFIRTVSAMYGLPVMMQPNEATSCEIDYN